MRRDRFAAIRVRSAKLSIPMKAKGEWMLVRQVISHPDGWGPFWRYVDIEVERAAERAAVGSKP